MTNTEPKSFRWSFSQWETYNACPAKWNYQSVLKLPRTPPGPAAARGLMIHDTIENYIGQRVSRPDPAVKDKYLPVFDEFKNHPNGERHCELKFSLTQDWQLAGGLLAGKAWAVMVLDAVRVGDAHIGPHSTRTTPLTAYVGEWKSGKPKDTHGDQRKLYAIGSLLKWHDIDQVVVTTYYVEDTAPPQRLTVANTDSARTKLKGLWQGRVDQMQSDKLKAPKPGMHCNWCDFSKRKGGPCMFGGALA